MTQNFGNYNNLFESKFRIVYYEIEYIRNKISLKKGIWPFKTHVYTQEELLNSEHHRRINTITEKIGSDVQFWYEQGKISPIEEQMYYSSRRKVDDELHSVNLLIINRQPTWWEEISEAFLGFKQRIWNNMPDIVKILIEGKTGGFFSKIINFFLPEKKKTKYLSEPKGKD